MQNKIRCNKYTNNAMTQNLPTMSIKALILLLDVWFEVRLQPHGSEPHGTPLYTDYRSIWYFPLSLLLNKLSTACSWPGPATKSSPVDSLAYQGCSWQLWNFSSFENYFVEASVNYVWVAWNKQTQQGVFDTFQPKEIPLGGEKFKSFIIVSKVCFAKNNL